MYSRWAALVLAGYGGHLEPQVMDLLVFLAATAGRVVSKDELIDAVWNGRFISETTLTRAVADLRRALGDNQRSPEYIETIPKRGYRLIAAVSVSGHTGAPAARNHAAPDHAAPDRGTIAARGDHLASSPRIADRLASERRRRFVGRERQIETFRSALLTDEPSFVAFTRGHPLALSLTADVLTRGDRVVPSRLEAEPEVVRLLIEKFVQDVPSRAHRLALHTCVSAHATTEPLLAAALDQADVHDVFEWLGRLSFVESGPFGLFPHDLARDVVYLDFRWRDPDAAYRVTERLIAYLYARLERTQGFEKLRTWFDVIYLQRYNSRLRPYMDWEGYGTTDVETASPAITRSFSKRSNATRGQRRPRSRATGWRASPKPFYVGTTL